MNWYAVKTAPQAEEQIGRQVLHIAEDSVDRALAWELRVRAAIASLADAHGYATDEDATDRLGERVHKLTFEGMYLIHFTADDATGVLTVVNFRHGARLPRRGEP